MKAEWRAVHTENIVWAAKAVGFQEDEVKGLVDKATRRGANLLQELSQASHSKKKKALLDQADTIQKVRLTSVMS
jgi:uncharacterized NAD-dependent epimerase/dehydratase family protein